MQSQLAYKPTFSCEFFPPADGEGFAQLTQVAERLHAALNLAYLSVTYGAGGSTQARTFAAVETLHQHPVGVAPHLTCIGSTVEGVKSLLEQYRQLGVDRIVALRGDLPSGSPMAGTFRHAVDLVRFIRREYGDAFHIEVAAYPEMHPQAVDFAKDVQHFKEKIEAGANAAITQYFYNADAYFHFVDECEKQQIDVPIVPGIMPITNYRQLRRFSDQCGAEIPRWIQRRLEGFHDDQKQELQEFGVEIVTSLCQRLLEQGCPGLHFYTMNRAAPTLAVWRNLYPA